LSHCVGWRSVHSPQPRHCLRSVHLALTAEKQRSTTAALATFPFYPYYLSRQCRILRLRMRQLRQNACFLGAASADSRGNKGSHEQWEVAPLLCQGGTSPKGSYPCLGHTAHQSGTDAMPRFHYSWPPFISFTTMTRGTGLQNCYRTGGSAQGTSSTPPCSSPPKTLGHSALRHKWQRPGLAGPA
jgi:hypothetical protein